MPVRTTRVACEGCGADLRVDETTRFVTCGYCSARLEIVRDPSASYTRVLEQVVRRQQAVEGELKVLRLERQLARLDQEWERFRQRVCHQGEAGRLQEPTQLGAMMLGVFGSLGGLVLVIAGISSEHWVIPVILGIGVALLTISISRVGLRNARYFQRLKDDYLARRHDIRDRLGKAEGRLAVPPAGGSGESTVIAD